ncbi:hypothetical protein GGF32_007675 [Allomyces javanicus]|nr:hypothetical protein GGF32_007675 [Allomyces javanicus]
MLHLFSETFGLAVFWGDYTILIRRVVLPLVECFLLTMALNPSRKLEFLAPGLLFSPRTMADPPHELEWREEGPCPPPDGLYLAETQVVVFTTFPGITARFGAAETVLHPSCKGDMATLFANLYDLVAEPVLLNRPRYLVGKDSRWLRIQKAAGIIARFLDLFDNSIAKPQTDLNLELMTAERSLGLLRAEMALAIVDAPISDQLHALLAEHACDIKSALDHPKFMLHSPRWQVPFLHNMYQWYRLVLVAHMAGFVLVMPHAGDAYAGQFMCLVHEDARECGRTVGVALSPNVVRVADERRVLLCAGYCDRRVPAR